MTDAVPLAGLQRTVPVNDIRSNKLAGRKRVPAERVALVKRGTERAQPLLTIVAQLAASGELAVSEPRCGLYWFTAA